MNFQISPLIFAASLESAQWLRWRACRVLAICLGIFMVSKPTLSCSHWLKFVYPEYSHDVILDPLGTCQQLWRSMTQRHFYNFWYRIINFMFRTCINPCCESNWVLQTGQVSWWIPSRTTCPDVSSSRLSRISPSCEPTASLIPKQWENNAWHLRLKVQLQRHV